MPVAPRVRQAQHLGAGGEVPEADGAVGAVGHQGAAIVGERKGGHAGEVAPQHGKRPAAGFWIPYGHGSIPAGRDDGAAVGRPRDAVDVPEKIPEFVQDGVAAQVVDQGTPLAGGVVSCTGLMP